MRHTTKLWEIPRIWASCQCLPVPVPEARSTRGLAFEKEQFPVGGAHNSGARKASRASCLGLRPEAGCAQQRDDDSLWKWLFFTGQTSSRTSFRDRHWKTLTAGPDPGNFPEFGGVAATTECREFPNNLLVRQVPSVVSRYHGKLRRKK